MFAQTVLEFAGYLNEVGYAVTPDKTAECISSFTDEDADCADVDDVIATMRFYFCKDPLQRKDLPEHFRNFIIHREALVNSHKSKEKIAETEQELQSQKSVHDRKQQELSEEIRELESKAKAIEEKVRREWQPDPAKFSKKDLKFLSDKKKWIDRLDMPDVEDILSGRGVSENDSKKAQKNVMKMAEDAMKSGDLARMQDLTSLFKILQKVKTNIRNDAPRREAAVKKATQDTMDKIRDLQEQKRRETQEHNRLQNVLTQKIAELRKSSLVVKPQAIQHRQEFVAGGNAVQAYNPIDCPPEAEKEFKRLTESEKRIIYKYIRDNILKFKTRLTRNLFDPHTGRIDMEKTIQNACRTGGLPMEIVQEIKRPGKSNMILMLDVSGSCKEASEMMITFMYLLQEVFPRGCKAFAFVNSLYDITDIMKARNAELAIRETLGMIPRSGQYSNYERPIRDMWEKNRPIINKDSLVLVIGDARNNKNGPAEDEFKNIVRRAKKAYWLNTDHLAKWGQGDSIAPLYAKYCKMFEVRTPKAIVQFLDQGMR